MIRVTCVLILLGAAAGAQTPPAAGSDPRQQMSQLVQGYRMSQMLHVAAKLGIAEQLKAGPRSVEELARATGAHADSLYRLLRTLSGAGVFFEEEGKRFRLTPAAELLLPGQPGSVRNEALVSGEGFFWKSWGGLLHSVKTGETAFDHLYGEGTFEWFRKHPAEARMFDAFQAELTRRSSAPIAEQYDFTSARRTVDVGGGNGQLLSMILAKNTTASCVLFDLPDVAEGARAVADPAMKQRCEFVGGDFFRAVPTGGDLYLLKFILHDWDDEKSVKILDQIRRAMGADAKLLVIESVVCGPNESCTAKGGDINMMVRTGGRNRTHAEYVQLLAAGGFKVARTMTLPGGMGILECTRQP